MGSFITKLFNISGGCKQNRILMLGLDAAGKTAICMKLKLGEHVHTVPTIGFSVETIEFKNLKFNIWDIGGQDKIRALWKHYFAGTDALIFVVDSSDKKRLALAKHELLRLLEDEELHGVPLLVFANKQDLGVMSPAQVQDGLGLPELKARQWRCQGCSALTGNGLYEGFEWLSKVVNQKLD